MRVSREPEPIGLSKHYEREIAALTPAAGARCLAAWRRRREQNTLRAGTLSSPGLDPNTVPLYVEGERVFFACPHPAWGVLSSLPLLTYCKCDLLRSTLA